MTLTTGDIVDTHGVLGPQETLSSTNAPEVTKTSRLALVGRGLSNRWSALLAVPHLGTYVGVALSGIGAVLLVVAWGKTAGLTVVSLQIPYVVSAGFTGLGLVAVGLTVVNIYAKQADSRERTRQTAELRDLLTELRIAMQDNENTTSTTKSKR